MPLVAGDGEILTAGYVSLASLGRECSRGLGSSDHTLRKNVLDIISFQEFHNSRRKREIAEKQTDDSRKFSLFAERKYQTLVSIFQQL